MTAETLDAVEGEVREITDLVPVVHSQAHLAVGVGALAAMSDEDFERNLDAMRKGVTRAARMKEAIMVADEDYGLIPGTKKATLLKPGAEKLALAYGLTGRFGHSITYGHAEDEPPITVVVDCFLHLGGHDGPVVAQGMGMASSFENRYRWRKGGRVCPDCSKEGVIWTKGRGGQWWHPSDAKPNGGCGANFPKDDVRLTSQETGQVENPDPFELGNTLLKMAEKRAYVDAVLRATASSGLFTQDMEDIPRPPADHRDDADFGDQRPLGTYDTPPPRLERVTHEPLIGTAEKGKEGSGADFELRETPDGHALAFRLVSGRKGWKVMAHDGLAQAIATVRPTIEGQRVRCYGRLTDEWFDKADKDDPKKQVRVTYQVLQLDRIVTDDFEIPARDITAPWDPADLDVE